MKKVRRVARGAVNRLSERVLSHGAVAPTRMVGATVGVRVRRLAEVLFDQSAKRSIFGGFCGICLHEVLCFVLQLIVETEYVIRCNEIYNSRRCHAVNLIPKDMPNSIAVVRELLLQLFGTE